MNLMKVDLNAFYILKIFSFPYVSFIQFPGSCHDGTELLVGVHGGTDVSIVVTELIEGNNAVLDLGVPEAHELHVDFML